MRVLDILLCFIFIFGVGADTFILFYFFIVEISVVILLKKHYRDSLVGRNLVGARFCLFVPIEVFFFLSSFFVSLEKGKF
jgi:hypothetical protein